jgi:hypothetical protein
VAAAEIIIILETAVLIAMFVVLGIHVWGSPNLKKRLSSVRHRFFDGLLSH